MTDRVAAVTHTDADPELEPAVLLDLWLMSTDDLWLAAAPREGERGREALLPAAA